jgi:hypothetical protein
MDDVAGRPRRGSRLRSQLFFGDVVQRLDYGAITVAVEGNESFPFVAVHQSSPRAGDAGLY